MPSRPLRVLFAICILCLLVAYLYDAEFLGGVNVQHVNQVGSLADEQRHHTPPAVSPSLTPTAASTLKSSADPAPPPAPSESASLTPISESTPTPTSQSTSQSTSQTLDRPADGPRASVSPDDVLLIIKTGASTFWRRMPLHLTTTLENSRVPKFVIYSDLEEQLSSSIRTVDVLANETSVIQKYDPSAYEVYLDQKSSAHLNTYREHAHLPGDEPVPKDATGVSPGWLLDKYKFLPMLRHAQLNWPDLKWYIYIEDDTFIFLNTILRYLATISPDQAPSYYGASSGPATKFFAQGGSGIVFSRSLMRSIFSGADIPDLEKYGNETSAACCGDIVLGKVLRDYQIPLNEGAFGTLSFRPEPPWKTSFDENMWCEEVFSFHHIHGRDLVLLSEMERRYENAGRSILFKDIFTELIYLHIQQQPTRTNWDNLACKYIITSNTSLAEVPSDMGPSAFENATATPETCQNACRALPMCMSWRHEEGSEKTCALDAILKLGREIDPPPVWKEQVVVTSGWMLERIESMMQDKCERRSKDH